MKERRSPRKSRSFVGQAATASREGGTRVVSLLRHAAL